MIRVAVFLIWMAGMFGYVGAADDHGVIFAPAAPVWPILLAYEAGKGLADRRLTPPVTQPKEGGE